MLLALLIDHPFCKYVCPLGAIYSFFNRASVYRLRFDKDARVHCGACAKACDPVKNTNDMECIRCGRSVAVCPTKALTSGWRDKKKTDDAPVCAGKSPVTEE